MATKRITQNTSINYTDITTASVLLVGQPTVDKKITFVQAKKYVLQNKIIGGSAATDIPTLSSAGIFTNKSFTSPVFNGTGSVTATGTQINKLAGCTATTTQLNKLAGLTATTAELNKLNGVTITTAQINKLAGITSNIQTTLNTLGAAIIGPTGIIHNYSTQVSITGTTHSISQATIISGLGLTGYVIDHNSIQCEVCQINANLYTKVDPISQSFTRRQVSGQYQLNTITWTGLAENKSFNFSINFKIKEDAGS